MMLRKRAETGDPLHPMLLGLDSPPHEFRCHSPCWSKRCYSEAKPENITMI